MQLNPPYKSLPHTADLRIKVFGKTKKELFANALRGMFEAIEPAYKKDAVEIRRSVQINSKDLDALIIDFLNEVLYLSDINNEAYDKIAIERLSDQEIKAIIFGKRVTGFREEIKAVTYHGAHLRKVKGRWEVEIIFDI